jgi:hypothetical protein
MFGKTNQTDSKKWVPWVNLLLLLIIIGGLHFFFTTKGMINKSAWMNNPLFQVIIPSLQIQTYAILDAINQFGGSSSEAAQFRSAGLWSAAGLLIVMILAPWLFVKGYFTMEKSDKPNKLVPVWYTGAAVIVISISVASFQITSYLIQNHDMKHSIEASRSMDELRGVMMDLAFDASQQLILPTAIDDEAASDFRLESLSSFREWEQFEIQITEQLGDSVLTLTGTLRDETLAQSPLSRPVTMRVTPQNDKVFRFVSSP